MGQKLISRIDNIHSWSRGQQGKCISSLDPSLLEQPMHPRGLTILHQFAVLYEIVSFVRVLTLMRLRTNARLYRLGSTGLQYELFLCIIRMIDVFCAHNTNASAFRTNPEQRRAAHVAQTTTQEALILREHDDARTLSPPISRVIEREGG